MRLEGAQSRLRTGDDFRVGSELVRRNRDGRPGRRNRLPAEPAAAGEVPEVGAWAVGRVLASEDVGRGLETRRRRAEVQRTRVTHP